MNIYQHRSYNRYVRVQRNLTARKTNDGKNTLYWVSKEDLVKINELLHSYIDDIKTIVCHGCRNGLEVNVLQTLNLNAKVFGTDIYGPAYKYDREYFREMDFDIVPKNWVEYFDVIYSNSIDHSRNPINTLSSWKTELKENGICFIAFHWGRGVSKTDCFHLDPVDPESEIKVISKQIMMKVLHISEPRAFSRRAYSVNVILSKDKG